MKPYSIMVLSSKGGVGKTTIAVNLATALQMKGHKTLLITGDNVNPFSFNSKDIKKSPFGVTSWIERESTLQESVSEHIPTGLNILGEIEHSINTDVHNQRALSSLLGSLIANTDFFIDQFEQAKYEYIITDTTPGYNMFDLSGKTSEALLVTHLDQPSIMGIRKVSEEFTRLGVKCRVAANAVKGKGYETLLREVRSEYSNHSMYVLPYDDAVPRGIYKGVPAAFLDSRSRFSKEISNLADHYISAITAKSAFL